MPYYIVNGFTETSVKLMMFASTQNNFKWVIQDTVNER